MGEHLLYTRLARYYDVIYREYLEHGVPGLVDVVEEVFRKFAGRRVLEVLDVACGTGGPTIELAKRGYSVVGVDLHPEMVSIAREKAERLGVRAGFRVADARELDKVFPVEAFDAVTMFFSSINYMTELSDLTRLLKAVAHVLRPGGVFVADTPNPYEAMYRYGSRGEYTATTWDVEGPEGEHLVLTDWREVIDWAHGVIKFKRLVTIIREDGEARSYLVTDTLRLYTATELELAAQQAGFKKTVSLCYAQGRIVEPSKGGKCGRIMFVAVK